VTIEGKPLDLTVREIAILEALIKRVGKVVVKTRLAQQIGDWASEVGTNTIEVYIHRLRKKLKPYDLSVRTIHGLGYMLEACSEN
jgi:DNA-binding response OmpR family regulator